MQRFMSLCREPPVENLRVLTVPLESLEACYCLRHNYFVREKKWVNNQTDGSNMETDRYDCRALHLAVYDADEVITYLRAVPHGDEGGFMLDHEFAPLLKDEKSIDLLREGAVELSRLVCRSDYVNSWNCKETHPVELLLRLLYQESKACGFQLFYIVVEEAWLRPFTRRFGLPFRVLGTPHTFPDGTRTVAAVATLEELEEGMKKHSASKYDWYQLPNFEKGHSG